MNSIEIIKNKINIDDINIFVITPSSIIIQNIELNLSYIIIKELIFHGFNQSSWRIYINLLQTTELSLEEIVKKSLNLNIIPEKLITILGVLAGFFENDSMKKYLLKNAIKISQEQIFSILKLKVAICYKSHCLHKKYTTEIDKLFNLINYKFRYKGNLLFNISISKITINNINISIAPKHCNLLKEIGFNSKSYKQYIELIKQNRLKLDEITKIIFNNSIINDDIIGLIANIASNINPDIMYKYLYKQSCHCFKNKCLNHKNLKEFIGLKDENILRKKIRFNSSEYRETLLNQINSICSLFENNKIIKNKIVLTYANTYNLHYKNIVGEITIPSISNRFQQNNIFCNNPKSIIQALKMLDKKCDMTEIHNETKIAYELLEKIFIIFFHSSYIRKKRNEIKILILDNKGINFEFKRGNSFEKTLSGLKKHGSNFEFSYTNLINKMRVLQQKIYKNINEQKLLDINVNKFNIGYIKSGIFLHKSFVINFKIKTLYLEYYNYFTNKIIIQSNIKKLKTLTDVLNQLITNNPKINSSKDITLDMVIQYLENKNTYLSRTHLSSFLTFTIKNYKINKQNIFGELPIPPFENITLKIKDVKYANKSSLAIPESIYQKIHQHIHTLQNDIRNTFIIMSAIACRINELEYINEDSLKYNKDKKYYELSFFVSKTQHSQTKKGRKSFRTVPIDDKEVIDAFYDQVKLTKQLRKSSNLKSIFLYATMNRKIKVIDKTRYAANINSLIKKYNIVDENNKLWHFTTHQLRATITTKLAESGYRSDEIMQFMGWQDKSTIEQAYIQLKKKRLMDLNSKFFYENFKTEIPNENLQKLSKKEKEELFIDLYVNFRQMEYGKCVRHPILGECGKLQEPKSCSSCSKLITSKEYLPKWLNLRDSQQNIINKLEIKFSEENIKKDEYMQWAEYKREFFILNSYNDLISKLS